MILSRPRAFRLWEMILTGFNDTRFHMLAIIALPALSLVSFTCIIRISPLHLPLHGHSISMPFRPTLLFPTIIINNLIPHPPPPQNQPQAHPPLQTPPQSPNPKLTTIPPTTPNDTTPPTQ